MASDMMLWDVGRFTAHVALGTDDVMQSVLYMATVTERVYGERHRRCVLIGSSGWCGPIDCAMDTVALLMVDQA